MKKSYECLTKRLRVTTLQKRLDEGGWIDSNGNFYDNNDTHCTNVSRQFLSKLDITYCPLYCVYLSTKNKDQIIAQKQLSALIKEGKPDDLFKKSERAAEKNRRKVQSLKRMYGGV